MTDIDLAKPLPADPSDALRAAIEPAAVADETAAGREATMAEPVVSVAGEPQPAASAPEPVAAAAAAPAAETIARHAAVMSMLGTGGARIRAIPGHVARHPRAAMAAGVSLAILLGFAGGRLGPAGAQADLAAQRWNEATLALRQSQDEVTRLAGEVRSVRGQVEALRTERQRTDVPAKLAQTSERLEKGSADHTARLAKLTDQIERLEKAQRDPSRIAGIVERLDRIERQTQTVAEKVAAPVPPAKPATIAVPVAAAPDVAQTGSVVAVPKSDKADAKPSDPKLVSLDKAPEPDPRKTPLDSYILRDIGDGVALIEARNGRLIEVRPGQALGSGNKVEAIERRGRHWVVVTAKGYIGER